MTQAINKPVETIDVYEINHRNAKDKIKFTLNLTGYKQCTIFIDDEIFQNNIQCQYENVYRDWPNKPLKIIIDNAMRKFDFEWNKDRFDIS